jgi:hypothetical protein
MCQTSLNLVKILGENVDIDLSGHVFMPQLVVQPTEVRVGKKMCFAAKGRFTL